MAAADSGCQGGLLKNCSGRWLVKDTHQSLHQLWEWLWDHNNEEKKMLRMGKADVMNLWGGVWYKAEKYGLEMAKKKKMLHKRGLKGEDESSEKQDLYRIGKNLSILRWTWQYSVGWCGWEWRWPGVFPESTEKRIGGDRPWEDPGGTRREGRRCEWEKWLVPKDYLWGSAERWQ